MMFFSLISSASECQKVSQLLKEGDLVFFGLHHTVFLELAKATKSWASHVGIVIKGKNGKWEVAESVIPYSRTTGFCKFIQRGYKAYYEIYRLKKNWQADEIRKLHQNIQARLGLPYDVWFNFNGSRQFCSKFVYEVFNDSKGIEVGQRQTFEDLRKLNPTYDFTFWGYWYGGEVPWQQVTVSPGSQLQDSDLYRVYKENILNPFEQL